MNWEDELRKIIENGCSDSNIEDFVDEHPEIKAKEIWDYVYEYYAPDICKGCKHIQRAGMMPCIECVRRANRKDYYESK